MQEYLSPEKEAAPRVSIIMPVYNQALYLHTSIGSVLAQTCSDWELLSVDDGSSDHSATIGHAYQLTDSRICLIQLNANNGAAVARNTVQMHSCGRYIVFLDADNLGLLSYLLCQARVGRPLAIAARE